MLVCMRVTLASQNVLGGIPLLLFSERDYGDWYYFPLRYLAKCVMQACVPGPLLNIINH